MHGQWLYATYATYATKARTKIECEDSVDRPLGKRTLDTGSARWTGMVQPARKKGKAGKRMGGDDWVASPTRPTLRLHEIIVPAKLYTLFDHGRHSWVRAWTGYAAHMYAQLGD